MRRHLVLTFALPAVAILSATAAEAASWIFRPSTYSHEPASGTRVDQYAPKEPSLARADENYLESGYRHIESTIRVGNSADHLHVVQTWGEGQLIRPYGEWLYPFRAGATPFGPWGNPQGPWTTPFESWVNPYGLGQLPSAPWAYGSYPQQGYGNPGYPGYPSQPGGPGYPGRSNRPGYPAHPGGPGVGPGQGYPPGPPPSGGHG